MSGVAGAQPNTGYWRVGGDQMGLGGWANSPWGDFAGWIDEVAIFHTQLSTTRIQVHYHSRNR